MRVLYLCDFDLSRYSGKDRATRQKLRALSKCVEQLDCLSANSRFNKGFNVVLLDFKAFYFILKKRPDVFVSRGYAGFFSLVLCKVLRIKSVREIHSDPKDELQYLDKPKLVKLAIYVASHLSHFLDKNSDKRIFNHPLLKAWYESKYGWKTGNYFVYNGFSVDDLVEYEKYSCRKQFGFSDNVNYIAFTGSASYWHGVDYLVELQRELNRICSNVKIVCAGGKVPVELDPDKIIKNITPLDDVGCAKIICAADACILPVKDVRVSPGSPLKLYDYISHKKPVITQNDLVGYSDEVERYGCGLLVDFSEPKLAAFEIINFIDSIVLPEFDVTVFSWDSRMREWADIFRDSK
ncbi:MAG: glycosyltransferase family 4 protein [Marinospirillum sp.]|uniref:glycosyltransferase n=1 Tax=Marinospirillum sp. TaxID=2183934 RepID=UPI001A0739F5|nr:glycosyltransferase [Marinospirillum sp.]MBE0505983.1 glycosyltransferase family 4 protein [Marinospirillum sp.]